MCSEKGMNTVLLEIISKVLFALALHLSSHGSPDSRHFNDDVDNSAHSPQRYQRDSDLPGHHPLVGWDQDEEHDKSQQHRDGGYEQGACDLDVVGLVVKGLIRVLLVMVLGALDAHVRSSESDAKEDVQHGTAEAGGSGIC